jgi:ferredoxin
MQQHKHDQGSRSVYQHLQQRFDAHLTGAPDSPVFIQILRLLYSPQEAEIARHLPVIPTSLTKIAQHLDMTQAQLEPILDRLARRGVVLDFSQGEQRYYALPPVVIGFFEYVFMRIREDLPMEELARLFDHYMNDDAHFASSVFAGETQLARAIIHEETLPVEVSEVLDWEKASEIIRQSKGVSVSLCSCRYKASLAGHACERPLETCLTLGAGGLADLGMARRLSQAEGLDILASAKEHGLMQICDNIQQQPAFICNCCGCCCGMVQAIRRFDLKQAIMTSNWIMVVDLEQCTGCGKCVKACPVNAISLEIGEVEGKRRGWALRDETLCLGCGVCAAACANGGITFQPRPQRVYTPETMLEHYLAMAIERGKLAELVFSQPTSLSQRALKRIIRAVERSSPFKAAMSVRPLRSAFMDAVVKAAGSFI